MAVTYTNNLFSGKYYQEIFSETLAAAKTFSGNYVHIMPNVKSAQKVTTLNASIDEQDYASDFNPLTAAKGGVTVFDELVTPAKKMFYTTIDPETLRFTRFGDDKMGAGARNLKITELENKMLDVLIPQMARSIEKAFWAQVLTLAGTKVPAGNKIVKAALTTANIVAEVEKVWTKVKPEVRATGKAVIYASESVKDLILLANLKDDYKDRFQVAGDSVKFLGMDILFVPFGAYTANVWAPVDAMLAGNKDEVIFATDVLNDEATIEINKVNNYSDILFYKSVYTRDAAIVIPGQKVLYS